MKYGKVVDGKVVNVIDIVEGDTLHIAKATDHGYLLIVKEEQSLDYITQIKGDLSYVVGVEVITVSFLITDRPLAEAKARKTSTLREELRTELEESRDELEREFIWNCGTAAQKTALETEWKDKFAKFVTARTSINNSTTVEQVRNVMVVWDE